MPHHVYILRLENDRLYVGSTNGLTRRLAEHRSGSGAQSTRKSCRVELLYSEAFPSRSAALLRERQLKSWSHAKKLALVNGDLSALKNLARRHS